MKVLLFLLLFAPQETEPEPFRLAPFLQNVTKTRITICWRTQKSSKGVIRYGKTEELKRRKEGPEGTK
ncbi:MAG: hypothetical protein QF645_13755, partial [Planctomycetota bacterium]|nr:hypothetical protein [Planctomycetota bacterium]